MVRPVRQYHNGFWYHVIARGQRGEPLFFSPKDRMNYLTLLDEKLTQAKACLGSFCLMTNHVHLLIEMGPVDLGKILHRVHLTYAKRFNQKRKTDGHVFQSRPRVKIILKDSYLLMLVPYIHQNPVKAGIVEEIQEYQWSSDKLFRGEGLGWMDLESWKFPPKFNGSLEERRKNYLKLMGEERERTLPGGREYIGTQKEFNQLERRKQGREKGKVKERRERISKKKIAQEICRQKKKITVDELKSSSRKRHIVEVRHQAMVKMIEEGYGPAEIGRFFNRTRGAVWQVYEKHKGE